MKIRIYAILPDTEANTMEPVSGVVKINGADELAQLIEAVATLNPEWKELCIERIVSQD
jgi:hypothetical protein